jgi:hypothetical protein
MPDRSAVLLASLSPTRDGTLADPVIAELQRPLAERTAERDEALMTSVNLVLEEWIRFCRCSKLLCRAPSRC